MPRKKTKPQKTASEVRRLRAEVDKILVGDTARANMISERGSKRAPGRIPAPPEVAKEDDPRSSQHLTVAVYVSAAPEDSALPADLQKWAPFTRKYLLGTTKAEKEHIRAVVCAGFQRPV